MVQFVELGIGSTFGLGIQEVAWEEVENRQAAEKEANFLTPACVLRGEKEGDGVSLGVLVSAR